MTDNHHERTRGRTILPWLCLIMTVGLGLATSYLFFLNRETVVPVSWAASGGARNNLADWFNIIEQSLIVALVAVIFGLLIVRQRPRQRIGWLLMFIGGLSALGTFFQEWAVYGYYTTSATVSGGTLAAWLTNWNWVVLFATALIMLALFPDGTFLSPRWRNLIILFVLLFAGPLFIGAATETPLSSAFQIPNPIVKTPHAILYNSLFTLGTLFMPLTAFAVLASLIVRFRQGQGRKRQQIKWLLSGVALLTISVVVGLVLSLGLGYTLGEMMVNASVLGPLAGIGMALLRHQLYDIDIIIRRTLTYTVITTILGFVYFGSVVLLQAILGQVTGERSPLVLVLSTLLIAALFAPLRRRIQDIIDRRFYRQKYDSAQVLARFAQTARDEVEMEQLAAAIIHTIEETIQPETVSIWLKPSPKKQS